MKALLLSTALLAIPAVASAATVIYDTPVALSVSAGDLNSATQTLLPDHVVSYTFTATESVVLSFSLAGTGVYADLDDVSYGSFHGEFDWAGIYTFPGSSLSSAYGTLASVTLLAGQSYTVNFYDGISNPVGITLTYSAAAVPVPAAGLLLVGAVGSLALARRRKA